MGERDETFKATDTTAAQYTGPDDERGIVLHAGTGFALYMQGTEEELRGLAARIVSRLDSNARGRGR